MHTHIITARRLMLIGILLLQAGCLTDPSQWSPEHHMLMSRNCRVACYPRGLSRYSSMDGSCECLRK